MGNRATITFAPFDRKNAAIYVHWNGGRASVEAFCKAAKTLGYRSEPQYGLARLTGLLAVFFGVDEDTSLGLGTVDELLEWGDDNGCWVIGGDWEIVEARTTKGVKYEPRAKLEYDVDELAAKIVAQVRAAAAAVKETQQ